MIDLAQELTDRKEKIRDDLLEQMRRGEIRAFVGRVLDYMEVLRWLHSGGKGPSPDARNELEDLKRETERINR